MKAHLTLSAIGFVGLALACVGPARGEDKEPVVTKAYKLDFAKVQEGALPDEWETNSKAPLLVTKAGGIARLVASGDQEGGVAYALLDKAAAVLGQNFDLVLDIATPVPYYASDPKAEARLEVLLAGTGGGKDLSLEIAPTANQQAYQVTVADATLKVTPALSSDKALNRFQLILERRGKELSVTAGPPGKLGKQTLVVDGQEVKSVPVPDGVTGFAGLKLGLSRPGVVGFSGDMYLAPKHSFQVYGLQIRTPNDPKKK